MRRLRANGGTLAFDCGEVKYEPQSVEAVKGSMQCSGGSRFDILDDGSKPWKRTTVNDPDPEPTDPEPGSCTAPAWTAGGVYLGGANVSHDGRSYQATWWTTDENPAQSGQWGVWKDLGAC